MAGYRLRVFYFELPAAHADKNEGVAVAADAEDAFGGNVFACLEILEALADLLDDGLVSRRIGVQSYLARSLRVFVFNDYAAIF